MATNLNILSGATAWVAVPSCAISLVAVLSVAFCVTGELRLKNKYGRMGGGLWSYKPL